MLDNNKQKLEDFEEGISAEQKFQLAKDLTALFQTLQSHDQSIFQIIAGLNACQSFIQKKLDITDKEFEEEVGKELETIQKKFMLKVKEMEEKNSKSS